MFDNYAPGYVQLLARGERIRLATRWFGMRTRRHIEGLASLSVTEKLHYLALRAQTVGRRIRSRVWERAVRIYLGSGRALPRRLEDVREAGLMAQRAYVPRLYHGRPLLFVVRERWEEVDPDPLFGWGGLSTEGIDIQEIPGNHVTMWEEPNAEALAAELTRWLERAQGGHTLAA
jgi:thioesterase domain-containing protein